MKKQFKAIALGAVLWDIIGENEYIGGAPFNFAVNMAKLGAEVSFLTAVGDDEHGRRAIEKVKEYGISDNLVQILPNYQTGYAKATLDGQGNAVYDIPNAAFDQIIANEEVIEEIKAFNPDLIYLGSFEQRYTTTRTSFEKILNQIKPKYVFFDINIRMGFADKGVLSFGFEKSNVVKLNEDEAKLVSNLFYGEELKESVFAERLRKDFNIECLVVTLGEKGCKVYADKEYFSSPIPAKTGDTIGAGDAFSGAFAISYIKGEGAQISADKGNLLGSYVASRRGALPEIEESILQALIKD